MTQGAFELENPERIAEMLKALGHPMRLRILNMLGLGPQSVTSLARRLGIPQCSVSHHVRILQAAHVVTSKRVGTYVMYDVVRPALAEIIVSLKQSSDLNHGEVPSLNTR